MLKCFNNLPCGGIGVCYYFVSTVRYLTFSDNEKSANTSHKNVFLGVGGGGWGAMKSAWRYKSSMAENS